jgi:hypothetical protein
MFRNAYPAAMQTNMPTAIGSGGSRFGSRQTQVHRGGKVAAQAEDDFASSELPLWLDDTGWRDEADGHGPGLGRQRLS